MNQYLYFPQQSVYREFGEKYGFVILTIFKIYL